MVLTACKISMAQRPEFACSALYMISEFLKTNKSPWPCIQQPEDVDDDASEYDVTKRDPKHSNANKSCIWELVRMTFHSSLD